MKLMLHSNSGTHHQEQVLVCHNTTFFRFDSCLRFVPASNVSAKNNFIVLLPFFPLPLLSFPSQLISRVSFRHCIGLPPICSCFRVQGLWDHHCFIFSLLFLSFWRMVCTSKKRKKNKAHESQNPLKQTSGQIGLYWFCLSLNLVEFYLAVQPCWYQ